MCRARGLLRLSMLQHSMNIEGNLHNQESFAHMYFVAVGGGDDGGGEGKEAASGQCVYVCR